MTDYLNSSHIDPSRIDRTICCCDYAQESTQASEQATCLEKCTENGTEIEPEYLGLDCKAYIVPGEIERVPGMVKLATIRCPLCDGTFDLGMDRLEVDKMLAESPGFSASCTVHSDDYDWTATKSDGLNETPTTESKPSLCGSRIDVPPGNDSIRDRPNAPGSAAELQLAEESVEELEFLEEINAFITWLRANPAKK